MDTLERKFTLQEDVDGVEEWVNKILMTFNNSKLPLFSQGNHNPELQYSLGFTSLGTSSGVGDLGVLEENGFSLCGLLLLSKERQQIAGLHQQKPNQQR